MPKLTIVIETDNDAFGETPHERAAEVASILREYARSITHVAPKSAHGLDRILRDVNGNTVGLAKLSPKEA